MSNLLNAIILFLIVVIVSAVCSTFFYKKGQESAWAVAEQLVPLEKDEIYLAVEKTDANGVEYLTVQEISQAIKTQGIAPKELKLRMKIALNGMSYKEFNQEFRGGNNEM
jgi:hypothetical protein